MGALTGAFFGAIEIGTLLVCFDGRLERMALGSVEGAEVGSVESEEVIGADVGLFVASTATGGLVMGALVGALFGSFDGSLDGAALGSSVGISVGKVTGLDVEDCMGGFVSVNSSGKDVGTTTGNPVGI